MSGNEEIVLEATYLEPQTIKIGSLGNAAVEFDWHEGMNVAECLVLADLSKQNNTITMNGTIVTDMATTVPCGSIIMAAGRVSNG